MYQRDGGEGNTNNKTNIKSLSSPHILQQQAGGMEAQQTASHKHKNLSWDVRDSWNLFIQHPRASLKCYPTTVSGQRFSASPGRNDLGRKVPGNWTQEQALAGSLLQPAREMLHIAKLQLQDPGGNKMCLPGVCFDAFIQGFPLQKFKIVKWIQDWPLNHTHSSAKEKHVDARKPFGNKYIHITSAPWENIGSFLGPCWTEGNKDHLWKSLRGKNC